MPRIELPSGIALNTRIEGPEGAPWVMLSNSLGADLSMWDGQVDLLAGKYRVLRYDQRGHGQSDAPDGPYSFEDLAEDAIAIMDHHGVDKADWISLSMGAMTGMGLAIDHPERFGRMVFADARSVATDAYRQMWDQRIATIQDGGVGAVVEGSLGLWLTDEFREANPDVAEACAKIISGTSDKGYIASCYALRELNFFKDLDKITLPVLYLCGGKDKGAPPEEMQEMARVTPRAQYIEIPDAGHLANINQPRAFNEALASYLDL
ncbi:alpha/beta fold hydrolase [Histidinibacterium aquaticum]|uniref:Alpha/beta fold hydrolase n=1 Tax=Histidinibacterium aquaticum TaxID=2613962 RepID=A0A5J5GC39_9RHOB|nr:alpha/beta fold hydrolase [Histidinibacterium aquaticum]KAA9005530.1 alpha/beta fold hydrolase [Histidinibacterium aquaticum]